LEAGSVGTVVTDPVWVNTSVDFGIGNPVVLLALGLRALPDGVKRLAIQLGCDTDPRQMIGVSRSKFPFVRVVWLEYARPHYKGRILYGADVAYLYGEIPSVQPGRFVIGGKHVKTDTRRNIADRKENAHPCPRSLAHVRWLIKNWTELDEVVCDPFMGSCTTGVACVQMGRRFIGIEIDPRYYDIACQRIEKELARTPLFDAPQETQHQGELFGDSEK
jgi:hypothetical protein